MLAFPYPRLVSKRQGSGPINSKATYKRKTIVSQAAHNVEKQTMVSLHTIVWKPTLGNYPIVSARYNSLATRYGNFMTF